MTVIHAMPEGAAAELGPMAARGATLCAVDPASAPVDVVRALNAWALERRSAGETPEGDQVIAVGALLGEQFVRAFGWRWAELVDEDGRTAFALFNPDETAAIEPINWAYWTLVDQDEVTFALTFAMIAADEYPRGPAGDPITLH